MVSASFARRVSVVGALIAVVAIFSHRLGTLMKTLGRTSGSCWKTTRGSTM